MINEIDKYFAKHAMKRSELSTSKELNNKTWHKGNRVICLIKNEIFDGEIVGFYDNSALVQNPKRLTTHCVSFRNLLDPATNKPLRLSNKEETVTADLIREADENERW